MSLISSHHSPVDEGSNERLKSICFDSRFAFNPLSTSPDMCVDSNVCILAWRAHPCPNYQTSSGPLSTVFRYPTIADKTQARHLWTSTLLISGRCIPLFRYMRPSSSTPGKSLSSRSSQAFPLDHVPGYISVVWSIKTLSDLDFRSTSAGRSTPLLQDFIGPAELAHPFDIPHLV